jgi:hypothetical protein
MNNEEAVSCADMILHVFSNIEEKDANSSNKLFNIWHDVVSNVNGYGEKLVAHTKLIDLKNGILLVETDHPGWIQILQIYSKFIITGINRKIPFLKIKSLAYRLEGSNASLCGVDYESTLKKEQQKMNKKIEEEEKAYEKYNKHYAADNSNLSEGDKLPPELKAKFDSIRQSMLTNSDK